MICANGTLAKPKLAIIDGMETFEGHSFHTSRWDYDFTGQDLELLEDKVVGIIGTGASAVQIVPNLGATAKELYVFQRTPSSIDIRDDWATDPEWAAKLSRRLADEAAGQDHLQGARAAARNQSTARRDQPRGEDPPAGERQHRRHDADPPAHRRDRRGPGDGRSR